MVRLCRELLGICFSPSSTHPIGIPQGRRFQYCSGCHPEKPSNQPQPTKPHLHSAGPLHAKRESTSSTRCKIHLGSPASSFNLKSLFSFQPKLKPGLGLESIRRNSLVTHGCFVRCSSCSLSGFDVLNRNLISSMIAFHRSLTAARAGPGYLARG